MIEILITLAFPSLKKLGFDLANKKILSLFKFRSLTAPCPAKEKRHFYGGSESGGLFIFCWSKKAPFR